MQLLNLNFDNCKSLHIQNTFKAAVSNLITT